MKRRMIYSGSWYPKEINELDKIVKVEGSGDARSAILPHAGLYYSAPLISSFFQNLDKEIKKVIILSPSHRYALPKDMIVTSSFSEAETPYGSIETFPFPLTNTIVENNVIEREHAIEMFLPFIKKKGLSVSFGVISRVSSIEVVEEIAKEIGERAERETAIIASSDFTHYGRSFDYTPYKTNALERVKEHDLRVASLLAEKRVEDVFPYQRTSTICGIAPSMILSEIAKERGMMGKVANHYTSYDVTHDDDNTFVSYVDVFFS